MKLPWGLRWWELLPEIVVGLALGLFLITETSAATSAFKSGTAIKLMALVAVAWFVGRFVLVRYTGWPGLRFVVFAAAAAAVVVVVVVPAYNDTTVVEALPAAAAQPSVTRATVATTTTSSVPAAPSVTRPAVPSTTTTTSSAPAEPPVPAPAPTTSSVPPGPPETEAPAPQPVAVRSSAIHGIDHRARGTAVIYRQPDGSLLLGLERIDIQPGPDYDVYVVPGAGRERIAGGTRLDDLRGNKGTQYYPVPSGTDVSMGQWTVLVWCQTFDVPVAGATPV